ncbi:MAG: family 16 glycoside hydrolase, partial [Bythopirellula sp.]
MSKSLCLWFCALFAFASSTAVSGAKSPATKQNVAPDGFVSLFNGTDLTGWCGRGHVHPEKFRALPAAARENQQAKADADLAKHWKVEAGEIINDGHGVFCTTADDFGDFELLVDWKMVKPGTDSGIYLRGSPQVQIWDPNNESQHKHGAQLGSGGLWNNNPKTPGKDPLEKADSPVGEWNTLRIKLVGDRATIHLNGKLVVDNAVMHNFWDRKIPLYEKGPIQLQTHGGEMRFRNVFIRAIEGEAASGAGNIAEPYTATIPGTEVTFDMVPIPAGEFQIGSPEDEEGRNDDEGPQVQVRVGAFWMGKHEVTWAEYQRFMELHNIFDKFNDLGIRTVNDDNIVDAVTAPSKLYEPSFTFSTGDAPDQPAVSMTQFAAKQYTKWLSLTTGEFYRLPTEAEWEYA